jgi:hypothetical protein
VAPRRQFLQDSLGLLYVLRHHSLEIQEHTCYCFIQLSALAGHRVGTVRKSQSAPGNAAIGGNVSIFSSILLGAMKPLPCQNVRITGHNYRNWAIELQINRVGTPQKMVTLCICICSRVPPMELVDHDLGTAGYMEKLHFGCAVTCLTGTCGETVVRRKSVGGQTHHND